MNSGLLSKPCLLLIYLWIITWFLQAHFSILYLHQHLLMLSKTFDKYGLFWVCTNSENNMELQSHHYFLSPVFSLAQQMSIEKKNMFLMLFKLLWIFHPQTFPIKADPEKSEWPKTPFEAALVTLCAHRFSLSSPFRALNTAPVWAVPSERGTAQQ